jgi:hypothetical protein
MKYAIASIFVLAAASVGAQEIQGRYVEARTASVMAGACHYNGEVVTRGRDAVMAFRIDKGHSGALDLQGVKAVAIVTSADNLVAGAERRTLLVIDSAASDEQAAGAAAELRGRYAKAFGDVVDVKRAPVSFTEKDGTLEVDAPGYATLSVHALADRACCKMPHLVWYEPLVPLADRQVGYTVKAESKAFTPWMDAGENTAFHGTF